MKKILILAILIMLVSCSKYKVNTEKNVLVDSQGNEYQLRYSLDNGKYESYLVEVEE